MIKFLSKLSEGIDYFVEQQGNLTSLLILPLMGVIVYEVIMRYAFNAPTIWGFEATGFLYGVHFMLGLSYMEHADGHVKVDIITARLSAKWQAIVGIISYGVIFIPVFSCMTIWAFKFANTSFAAKELNSTSWAPPIYPFKTIMAFSFLFLLCQGISTLIKHIKTLTKPDNAKC